MYFNIIVGRLLKRGNVLPGTFAAETRFLDVSQFCHTGNIASVREKCFCWEAGHILLLKTMFPV